MGGAAVTVPVAADELVLTRVVAHIVSEFMIKDDDAVSTLRENEALYMYQVGA